MSSASGVPTRPVSQEKVARQLGLIKQVYQAYTVLHKQADGSIDKALGVVADAAWGERTEASSCCSCPLLLVLLCALPAPQVHCHQLPMPSLLP